MLKRKIVVVALVCAMALAALAVTFATYGSTRLASPIMPPIGPPP